MFCECSRLSSTWLTILCCLAGFGIFAVFILPKLKVDPEEEAKEGEGAEQVAGGAPPERLTGQHQAAGRRSGSSKRRD